MVLVGSVGSGVRDDGATEGWDFDIWEGARGCWRFGCEASRGGVPASVVLVSFSVSCARCGVEVG